MCVSIEGIVGGKGPERGQTDLEKHAVRDGALGRVPEGIRE